MNAWLIYSHKTIVKVVVGSKRQAGAAVAALTRARPNMMHFHEGPFPVSGIDRKGA